MAKYLQGYFFKKTNVPRRLRSQMVRQWDYATPCKVFLKKILHITTYLVLMKHLKICLP